MPHPIGVTTPSDREIRVTRVFDAPRRLVFDSHTQPELVRRWLLGPPEALCTLTLEEESGRTMLMLAMVFATKAERDQALESGMTDGMGASYDRMASLLESQRVP